MLSRTAVRAALDIKSSMIASLKTASLTFFVGMHPFVSVIARAWVSLIIRTGGAE
jgi:hypothetical protein